MVPHEPEATDQTPGTNPGETSKPAGGAAIDTAGGGHPIFWGNLPVSATAASPFKVSEPAGGAAIDTVFFGGGTPTVLPAGDLVRILRDLDAAFGLRAGAEVTTEANPDTVDAGYLEALATGGFTRVSFGMQSAVSSVLRVLDRTHTQANLEAGVRAAQDLGLEVSVDLIYGTPGESLAEWRESVEAALALGVSHVSCYALTIEENTALGRVLRQGQIAPVDGDDQAEKYELADRLLSAAGLEWYEISNWARPGHECRHNLAYWQNRDYYGFGPGAHSHLGARFRPGGRTPGDARVPGGQRFLEGNRASGGDVFREGIQNLEGQGMPGDSHLSEENCPREGSFPQESRRFWNLKHPATWDDALRAGRLPIEDGEVVTGESAQLEDLLLGLRLRTGLDLRAYAHKFDPAPHESEADSDWETAPGSPRNEKVAIWEDSAGSSGASAKTANRGRFLTPLPSGCADVWLTPRGAAHENKFEGKLLAEARRLAAEGLVEAEPLGDGETCGANPRAVLTRRGRLLADTVIQRLAAI